MRAAAAAALLLCLPGCLPAAGKAAVSPRAIVADVEERSQIHQCVEHIHRQTSVPLNINVLRVDISKRTIGVFPCMSFDVAVGVERVSSMTTRTSSLAGINGDHWGGYGIPSGMTMIDGELITAPRFRSVFAIRRDGTPYIGKYTDTLLWRAKVIAPNGRMRDISSLNQECNEDWLGLYTARFGIPAGGNKFPQTTAVVMDQRRVVQEVRVDQPGVAVPVGGYVLVGRASASDWIQENVKLNDTLTFDLKTDPPWQQFTHAVGGGPELLRNGAYWNESLEGHPAGEDFEPAWKKKALLQRQARTIIAHSRDKNTIILMTVDGDQPGRSIGVLPEEAAQLVREFGGWNAMFMGGGAATTMVIGDKVVSSLPARGKNPPEEPLVSNAVLVRPVLKSGAPGQP